MRETRKSGSAGAGRGNPSRLPTGDTLGGRLKTSRSIPRAKRIPALAGGPGGPAVLLVREFRGAESPFEPWGAAGGRAAAFPKATLQAKQFYKNSLKN